MKKLKQMSKIVMGSALSILGSAGNALAASKKSLQVQENGTFWTNLNIHDGVVKFVDQLDPSFQPAVTYLIDHVFALAIIFTLALLWWHSFSEKEAKRSGSISGQAQHESIRDKIMKNFGLSVVYSVVIVFVAIKMFL